MNVGKCNVMRYSRYGNWGRMHARLNSEPLEEVDCFKYLGRKWLRIDVVKQMRYTE